MHGRFTRTRKDLYRQKADALPQLDRRKHQGFQRRDLQVIEGPTLFPFPEFQMDDFRRRKVTDEYHNHSFFDPENDKAMEIRTQVAEEALTDCLKWLQQEEIDDATNGEGSNQAVDCQFDTKMYNLLNETSFSAPESAPGDVAIFDATNVTEERRKYIYER